MTTATDFTDLTAAQLATVTRSRAKLDRAQAYAGCLAAHAAEIRTKLAAASEHQVAAAIGKAEADPADVGPLRGELVTVDRQHRQALDALADIETEHARHEADLAVLVGVDGAARKKLTEAHAIRALAQTAADDAKAVLDRAVGHADAVSRKLITARADEARHDADASARLRTALADGDALPTTAEPFLRTSSGIEDDLRAATAAVDALKVEHAGKAVVVAEAERQVRTAAETVMLADADAMEREIGALDARLSALRSRLAGCPAQKPVTPISSAPPSPAKLHPGGWYYRDPPALPAHILTGTAPKPVVMPTPADLASWAAYATALAEDPDAEPTFTEVAPPLPVPAVLQFLPPAPSAALIPHLTRDAAPQRVSQGRSLVA